MTLRLPARERTLLDYEPGEPVEWARPAGPFKSRVAFAAAHVVCDPLALEEAIDWDATLAYRRYLYSYGFAVAEAMDTAQRGMGLDWTSARELISRSVADARSCGGTLASGAGTDHLAAGPGVSIDDVVAAYETQCEFVQGVGGRIILMASRALAACARSADQYAAVYGRVLSQVREPVILHWLGDAFDPALAGYWGSRDVGVAMDTCLAIIEANRAKVDGIKISLLNAEYEIEMRRRLPAGVRMYTGDDFNYDRLILGDAVGHSDALLGIFDAIAPAASGALQALDAGDVSRFLSVLEPTVALSRCLFQTPTYSYKTGIVFLAWLNGHQAHFRMIGGKESARSVVHLSELFQLADKAGLLRDPDLATRRMRLVLAQAGVE